MLKAPCIHALTGQRKAGGMPEHMSMHRKADLGLLACSLDHAADAHTTEWLPTLVDEYIGFGLLLLLQSF